MNDTREGWFARALQRPDALRWIVLIAVALVLPTLGAGLLLDDWTHRMALDPAWQHPGSIRGPWDLSAPDTLGPLYVFARRLPEGRPVPERWVRQLVVPASGASTLRRDGPRRLVLVCSAGVPHDMFGPMCRGRAHPFRVGEVARTGGMRAEVRALTADGRAREVRGTGRAC